VQRDIRLVLAVRVHDPRQVDTRQDVAVEDHHVGFAQLVRDVADGARRVERYLLDHVLELQTEPGTVTEVLLEHLGLVGGAEHHVGDPGLLDPRQQVREKGHPRGRQHGLGSGQGQRAKTGALAPDQHHSFDAVHLFPPPRYSEPFDGIL
jgi:hypothetical protein